MKRPGTILLLLLSSSVGWGGAWTLSEALAYARTNSPDARIAEQRIIAAEAALDQAKAAFWPKLQLQSSYTRTDNPTAVFGTVLNQRSYSPSLDFNNVPDADNLNVRALLSVPIYAGGQNAAGRKAAKAGTLAARAGAEAVAINLEFAVARAFQTVVKTHRYIEAAESAVKALQASRVVAEKRLQAGTLLKSDLLDIEVRLGRATEDLVTARNSDRLALLALKNLLGLENQDLKAVAGGAEITFPTEKDASLRPEMRALEFQMAAAEAEVKRAKGGYRPRVSAFGQVDRDSGWKFSGSGESYAVGVVAQWDLWDGGTSRGRVREARAKLEELEAEQRKVRLAMELETEEARLKLNEAEERLRVTEHVLAQAEESLHLTRMRFDQGLSLSSQLLDAETALTAARIRRADAEGDQQIAIAALRRAYGLGQEERIHSRE